MKLSRTLTMLSLLYFASTAFTQTHPEIFDVSDVVLGAQRLDTKYLYASGAWSDAGEMENAFSVQIECYKRIAYCNVAHALVVGQGPRTVGVGMDGFDVLRWDEREMIAVDSSAICVVNTIRADFVAKTITISSAKKATKLAEKDALCQHVDESTAVLVNHEELLRKDLQKAKQKKP